MTLRMIRLNPRPVKMDTRGYVKSKSIVSLLPIMRASRSASSSTCAELPSLAYSAPMHAPIDVPPIMSTGTPHSSSARSTPMCARPRAPPPPSVRPTVRPVKRRARRIVSVFAYTLEGGGRTTSRRDAVPPVTSSDCGRALLHTGWADVEVGEGGGVASPDVVVKEARRLRLDVTGDEPPEPPRDLERASGTSDASSAARRT
mmetsp:Transcript_6539/g.21165  ORF Transcript_6539/g.21165 Transcript_6539/m.21165 type:complete len:202 (+) Transcript_6539:1413-2018(+)